MAARMGVCNLCSILQRSTLSTKLVSPAICTVIPVRSATNKHWDPRWKKHRRLKFLKFDLPDYDKTRREASMTMDEVRAKMKREGVQPSRHGKQERNIILACTGEIDNPYEPPEGDGVASPLDRAKHTAVEFGTKGKSYKHSRTIRKYEEFDPSTFADKAFEIYVRAHECLQDIKNNEDELHRLVTEKAYPEMVWQLQKKTFRWKLHEQLEPSKVVQVRTVPRLSKEDLFAQVTVRIHSSQMLAIYDRFGRLQYGNENVIRDIFEYVVFEKYITRMYTNWRIHGKIIPDWIPSRTDVIRTMRQPKFEPEKESDTKQVVQTTKSEVKQEAESSDPREPTPQLAM